MVTAYMAEPKTGAIMLLLTPVQLEVLFILVLRGLTPETLNVEATQELVKGLELIYANYGPRMK